MFGILYICYLVIFGAGGVCLLVAPVLLRDRTNIDSNINNNKKNHDNNKLYQ